MHRFVSRNFEFRYCFDIIISIASISSMMNEKFIESLCVFVAVIMFVFQSFQCLKSFMTTTLEQAHSDFNFLTFRLALLDHCFFANHFSKSFLLDQWWHDELLKRSLRKYVTQHAFCTVWSQRIFVWIFEAWWKSDDVRRSDYLNSFNYKWW